MDDVDARARLAAEPQQERDRFILRCTWTRAQERLVLARVARGLTRTAGRERLFDRPRHLCVYDERGIEPRQLEHRRVQLALVNVRELLHAGVDEEALEADDAARLERREQAQIARHEPPPETYVHATLTTRRLYLLL